MFLFSLTTNVQETTVGGTNKFESNKKFCLKIQTVVALQTISSNFLFAHSTLFRPKQKTTLYIYCESIIKTN